MTCNYSKDINTIVVVTWNFEIRCRVVKIEFHYATLQNMNVHDDCVSCIKELTYY